MLPTSDDRPTSDRQRPVDPTIALNVASELFFPKHRVGLGTRRVFWAAMPEAAVDEDGDASPRKQQINTHANFGEVKSVVLAETLAARMQERAERQLWGGIFAPICAHRAPDARTVRPGLRALTIGCRGGFPVWHGPILRRHGSACH